MDSPGDDKTVSYGNIVYPIASAVPLQHPAHAAAEDFFYSLKSETY
jgi:hypothetical protein